MLAEGDRVLVGVSGGPDSMTLLHLLSRLSPAMKFSLGVAHLNHGLRGVAAERDAEAVRRAAADLGCACHAGHARVLKVKRKLGLSLEEAARRVRYAFFRKTMAAGNYNKLALGHHLDDNAEQMLLALLRGTGPRGLSGIAPVREHRIVRPLILVRRSQIEAYVAKEHIACVSDASNHDLHFLRNRIRHRLLPTLASEYNPRIRDHLTRLADVMRTEEAWIETLIADPYKEAVLDRTASKLKLCATTLGRAHPALARRLVRRALQDVAGTLRRITFAHVQTVLHLLADGSHGKALHLPGGLRVRRTGDELEVERIDDRRRKDSPAPGHGKPVEKTIITPPFPATVQMRTLGIGIRFFHCLTDRLPQWQDVGRNRAFFDFDRLLPPLTLRQATPGDRFMPLGVTGSQKLKKFFIDHHISRKDRAKTPVLMDRQRIIWVVGQRIDDRVKVTPETTHVLGAEIFLIDSR
jgi:tRNA(Ile)-lysidine synthase